MAQSSTIDDVYVARDNTVIDVIRGKLTKLYDINTGEGDFGPWSFQNGELSDGRDTIKVVFKDREEVSKRSFMGREIELASTDSKNGWHGVKAKDDKVKGSSKKERVLWVTSAADISIVGESPEDRGGREDRDKGERGHREDRGSSRGDDRGREPDRGSRSDDRGNDRRSERKEEPEDRGDNRRGEDRGERRNERPSSEPYNPEKHILNVKGDILRRCNLWNLCLDGVNSVIIPKLSKTTGMPEIEIPVEVIKELSTTIYLSLDKEGYNDRVSAARLLPFKMSSDAPREPERKPEPERQQRREPEPPTHDDAPPPPGDDDIPF